MASCRTCTRFGKSLLLPCLLGGWGSSSSAQVHVDRFDGYDRNHTTPNLLRYCVKQSGFKPVCAFDCQIGDEVNVNSRDRALGIHYRLTLYQATMRQAGVTSSESWKAGVDCSGTCAG